MNHCFNRSKVIFGCGVVYAKKVVHLSVGKWDRNCQKRSNRCRTGQQNVVNVVFSIPFTYHLSFLLIN